MSDLSSLESLEGIPEAALPLWKQLINEPLRPVHALFKEIRDYQQIISQRSEWRNADVDRDLANSLIDASLQLLSILGEETPESERRLVQAAVRYFIIEEDADSDLDSILGLDDDAQVVNAVLKHLGRESWMVEEV